MVSYLKVIKVPKLVNVLVSRFNKYNYIFVFGIFGFLKSKLKSNISIGCRPGIVRIAGSSISKYMTYIKIVYNLFYSVLKGYTQVVELRGLGFKFKLKNNLLFLVLGYSHVLIYKIPFNIRVSLTSNKSLKLSTNNVLILNRVIFELKKFKTMNIYKGKGIFLKEESPVLKVGKKPSMF